MQPGAEVVQRSSQWLKRSRADFCLVTRPSLRGTIPAALPGEVSVVPRRRVDSRRRVIIGNKQVAAPAQVSAAEYLHNGATGYKSGRGLIRAEPRPSLSVRGSTTHRPTNKSYNIPPADRSKTRTQPAIKNFPQTIVPNAFFRLTGHVRSPIPPLSRGGQTRGGSSRRRINARLSIPLAADACIHSATGALSKGRFNCGNTWPAR